jgi:hypothetical protein
MVETHVVHSFSKGMLLVRFSCFLKLQLSVSAFFIISMSNWFHILWRHDSLHFLQKSDSKLARNVLTIQVVRLC